VVSGSLVAAPNVRNPGQTISTILFASNQGKGTSLSIYNVNGEKVAVLDPLAAASASGFGRPGASGTFTHKYLWDGTNSAGQKVASGIYILVVKDGGGVHTSKILVTR
jgi:hypothetical protein